MQLTFNSIEEVREFIKSLKGTRGGKGGDGEDNPAGTGGAPAPQQPPQGSTGAPSFQAPQQQQPSFQAPAGGGFPGQPTGDPATAALVQRINTRIDGAIASGQPADTVLGWFRSQAGVGAENATMDQIKNNFLPKMAVPTLENIAKLMNA